MIFSDQEDEERGRQAFTGLAGRDRFVHGQAGRRRDRPCTSLQPQSPSVFPRHIRTNAVLCCPCAAQHQPRRTSAIHPQRACNLAARLLHKTPNQQDMSFSRMQDAENLPPPHRPPGLTDPPSPPRASLEAQSRPCHPSAYGPFLGRVNVVHPKRGTRLGLSSVYHRSSPPCSAIFPSSAGHEPCEAT